MTAAMKVAKLVATMVVMMAVEWAETRAVQMAV